MPIPSRFTKLFIAPGLITLGGLCGSAGAMAQADGPAIAPNVVAPAPAPNVFQPAGGGGPGAGLMNELHARMNEIQATPDPVLRQRRMDEFLKTLTSGMARISKQPIASANR